MNLSYKYYFKLNLFSALKFPVFIGLLILCSLNSCTKNKSEKGHENEASQALEMSAIEWEHLSTANGDLPIPNGGNQQTATLVCDIDGDGVNDFIITERTQSPSVTWYRRTDEGWDRYILEDTALRIEAGSAYHDIDGDGDLDVVFGGDGSNKEVWWWENPYPNYDPEKPWKRYSIKKSGANKHHDQVFADVRGNGQKELIFWNQGARKLFVAPVPENVKTVDEWEFHEIYSYEEIDIPQKGRYPKWKKPNEHEGLAIEDMDGDGKLDIVGGGRWFKHQENFEFEVHVIDEAYAFTRSMAGQFVPGDKSEVMLSAGDGAAPLIFYQWKDGKWEDKILIDTLYDGHSINKMDFNNDGNLDLFIAEMGLGNHPDQPMARILLGDGKGDFEIHVVVEGYGMHESLLVDLDGDGDLDILGKPYTWEAPRLDIWLNKGVQEKTKK